MWWDLVDLCMSPTRLTLEFRPYYATVIYPFLLLRTRGTQWSKEHKAFCSHFPGRKIHLNPWKSRPTLKSHQTWPNPFSFSLISQSLYVRVHRGFGTGPELQAVKFQQDPMEEKKNARLGLSCLIIFTLVIFKPNPNCGRKTSPRKQDGVGSIW
jgi:hypothetical protein